MTKNTLLDAMLHAAEDAKKLRKDERSVESEKDNLENSLVEVPDAFMATLSDMLEKIEPVDDIELKIGINRKDNGKYGMMASWKCFGVEK